MTWLISALMPESGMAQDPSMKLSQKQPCLWCFTDEKQVRKAGHVYSRRILTNKKAYLGRARNYQTGRSQCVPKRLP